MRTFHVPGMTPAEFVERARGALADHGLAGNVSLELRGRELVVRLTHMGSSELRYALAPGDHGFSARLVGERVALLHAPFRGVFDEKFAEIIARVGGSAP